MNGQKGLFELKTERVNVSAEVDEVRLQVPKVDIANITAEYDKYSKALRQLDTAIQAANWANEVDFTAADDIAV